LTIKTRKAVEKNRGTVRLCAAEHPKALEADATIGDRRDHVEQVAR
jgi:hypothetical protein